MTNQRSGARAHWEILVGDHEELAWFRDNLARVLGVLGYGELQSHHFTAQAVQDGYEALACENSSSLNFRISVEQGIAERRVHVQFTDTATQDHGPAHVCQWPDERALEAHFIGLCERIDLQFERKCRRQMNRELVEQNQELVRRLEAVNVAERATEAKGAFLASMSHELRTPMNSILGFTHRLRRRLDGKIDAKDLQALDVVVRNGNRLLSMINDILDFSKLEAEGEGLVPSQVFPLEMVETVLLQCDPLLGAGQRFVVANATPEGFCMEADGDKVIQILTNLVSNAIKYGGGEDIEIRIERRPCAKHGPLVAISVVDQGEGMTPQEQGRVFSPFTRLDNDATRAASGTGLGLAIAARYASMHKGHLEVDSVVGQGSTFCLTLPEKQAQVPKEFLAA